MRLVIAVDGPAASGKGTVAARLARDFALPYLDTGLLYRAVGHGLSEHGGDLNDPIAAADVARGLRPQSLDDPTLRTRAAGEAASRVAAHAEVRRALLDFQRDFASRPTGAVLDGRDVGTVIAPDAAAKLFVTAEPEVRAERRWRQLRGQGEAVEYADVLDDILRRDARDSGRDAAPLARAADAVLLDTTRMSIEEAVDAARRVVETARADGRSPPAEVIPTRRSPGRPILATRDDRQTLRPRSAIRNGRPALPPPHTPRPFATTPAIPAARAPSELDDLHG